MITKISRRLFDMIKRHEGYRQFPYRCTAGALTIGIGRNLDANGITEEEAEYLCFNDIMKVLMALESHLLYWDEIPVVIQEVLINMAFQMGIQGLLGFRRTLGHIKDKNYVKASEEMLNSRWASQTPNRAKELAKIVRNYKEELNVSSNRTTLKRG